VGEEGTSSNTEKGKKGISKREVKIKKEVSKTKKMTKHCVLKKKSASTIAKVVGVEKKNRGGRGGFDVRRAPKDAMSPRKANQLDLSPQDFTRTTLTNHLTDNLGGGKLLRRGEKKTKFAGLGKKENIKERMSNTELVFVGGGGGVAFERRKNVSAQQKETKEASPSEHVSGKKKTQQLFLYLKRISR